MYHTWDFSYKPPGTPWAAIYNNCFVVYAKWFAVQFIHHGYFPREDYEDFFHTPPRQNHPSGEVKQYPQQRKWVREHLSQLDIQKSTGSDGMHPRELRELADAILRLSITFLKGYGDGGGFLTTGRQMSSLCSKEEDLEIYRLVRLSSVSGKIMEKILTEGSFMHTKTTGNKQYWKFTNVNINIY